MTDTTESVTFPQLRWRIVVISSVFLPLFESESCKVLILRGFSVECYKSDVACYLLWWREEGEQILPILCDSSCDKELGNNQSPRFYTKTSMHSSKMSTARLLTVSRGIREGGGSAQGSVHLSSPHLPPPGQNSWHTLVKTLPCPKLRLRAVTSNRKVFQKDANRSLSNRTCFKMNKFVHVCGGGGESCSFRSDFEHVVGVPVWGAPMDHGQWSQGKVPPPQNTHTEWQARLKALPSHNFVGGW